MNEDMLNGFMDDIAKGNEQALQQLYEATERSVFHYIYRLVNNQQIAEDLLMETYIQIWKSAKNYRGHAKVLTWIIGIARNLTMNEFRNRKIKEDDLHEDILFSEKQFEACRKNEISAILKNALNRLSLQHREVLDLLFLQGLRYEEIAVILDTPLNTVKTRIFYAKASLRNIFLTMGITKDDLI
jgi:RNA polymerase sigma-70 factor (ECF subfamily)